MLKARGWNAIWMMCLLTGFGCAGPSTALRSRPAGGAAAAPGDFIQLVIVPFKWPIQTVRIYGDGRVDRDSVATLGDDYLFGCPLHEIDVHQHISATAAEKVIAKAQNVGLSGWDPRYAAPGPVLDAGSSALTLAVNGHTHTVRNHAGSPPTAYFDIIEEIERIEPPMPKYAEWGHQSDERTKECHRADGHRSETLKRYLATFPQVPD